MRTLIAVSLAAFFLPAIANAACEDQFAGRIPLVVVGGQTTPLCYGQFAVLYSNDTKTPVYSAEHLSRDRVNRAATMPRPNPGPFHTDGTVSEGDRANLVDYHVGSAIYDRGHMAPNGDMPDRDSQYNSFSLANMIPQQACNNEGIWEQIEDATRSLAQQDDDLFVVTGPIYDSATPETLGPHAVAVPTRIFKAIYDPARHAGGVYITNNNDDQRWSIISLAALNAIAGIDPFPDLDTSIKTQVMELPGPAPARFACRLKR